MTIEFKDKIEEKAEAEKPKNAEIKAGKVVKKSWVPAARLGLPKQFLRSDRRYRWCTDSVAGNIAKKQAEQWQVDHDVAPAMAKAGYSPATIDDAKIDGTVLRVNQQILMWMPMETAEARAEYHKEKSNLHKMLKKENDKLKETIAGSGGKTYGKITIE